jgi:hypothetical protein
LGSLLPPEKTVALHHQTLTCRIKRCDGTPHLRNRLHCPWRNVVSFSLQINSQGNLAGPGDPVDVRRNGVQLLQDAVDVEFRPFCHSIRHFSPPDTIDKYGRRPSDLNELVAGRRKERLRRGSKLQPNPIFSQIERAMRVKPAFTKVAKEDVNSSTFLLH